MSRTARLPQDARVARSPRHRFLLPVAAVVAATLTLSGCAAGQISQTADQVAAIDGANATVGKVGVRNVLLATPTDPKGLTKGADAPVLMLISNDGTSADTLTAASSPAAASVQISGAAEVPGQSLVQFSDKSEVKVTLKGLTQDISYGVSVPVTFTFAKAGAVTVNVPIEIPAERPEDHRETINILPPHPTPLWESGEAEGGH